MPVTTTSRALGRRRTRSVTVMIAAAGLTGAIVVAGSVASAAGSSGPAAAPRGTPPADGGAASASTDGGGISAGSGGVSAGGSGPTQAVSAGS